MTRAQLKALAALVADEFLAARERVVKARTDQDGILAALLHPENVTAEAMEDLLNRDIIQVGTGLEAGQADRG